MLCAVNHVLTRCAVRCTCLLNHVAVDQDVLEIVPWYDKAPQQSVTFYSDEGTLLHNSRIIDENDASVLADDSSIEVSDTEFVSMLNSEDLLQSILSDDDPMQPPKRIPTEV